MRRNTVTFSPSPDNARNKFELETGLRNPLNVVGASKRFFCPRIYDATLVQREPRQLVSGASDEAYVAGLASHRSGQE